MIGVVLAAGTGSRLRPLTDNLPKTLLPIDNDRTILDVTLANLHEIGIQDVLLVVGHAAEELHERRLALERAYGLKIELRHNDRYERWNNAYSLWLARDAFTDDALLCNGDTLHPVGVEATLYDAHRSAPLLLAIDQHKSLGGEEMKVEVGESGSVRRVHKGIDPARADGEYIGVCLIDREAALPLAAALRRTFERDASLYYEDGFQDYVTTGSAAFAAPLDPTQWVEVDDYDDLLRAREIACLY